VLILERVSAAHAPAILQFERDNRTYFAQSITDRGDGYFARFDEAHAFLLDEQSHGRGAYFVALGKSGEIPGRINLYQLTADEVNIGYRVGAAHIGNGLATAMVRAICLLAQTELQLRSLFASVSDTNVASQRVLERNGFLRIGPADSSNLGDKTGQRYRRSLVTG
jgi:ribosomal-protein-alanine N-acetyltransferase